jgi:hypothetical protein
VILRRLPIKAQLGPIFLPFIVHPIGHVMIEGFPVHTALFICVPRA